MSSSADLQKQTSAILAQPGKVRVVVPIVDRRTKRLEDEIKAAAANKGLCIYVMPPLPVSKEPATDDIVLFNKAEVRVRIIEQPAINQTGFDAYDLADDVMLALHWQPFDGILSYPLELAPKPCEMADDPNFRIIDVIFNAVYQLVATSN